MKITYFYPHLRSTGGIERILIFKANYLAEIYNYQITIVTHRQNGEQHAFPVSPQVRIIDLDLNALYEKSLSKNGIRRRVYHGKFLYNYKKKTAAYLKENPQDISISLYFGKEYLFLHKLRDHSKKIIEFHFSFNNSLIGSLSNATKNYIINLKHRYYLKEQINILNSYNRFICLTKGDQDDWKRILLNTEFIHNPQTLKFNESPKLDSKKALFVGRIAEDKGIYELLRIWQNVQQNFPEWTLDIYGSGPLEEFVKKEIKKHELRIFIRQNKKMEHVYPQYSVFLFPCKAEGFPLALAEAVSAGVPSIAFNCKHGPSEIITNNKNGFLVEPNNISRFTDILSKMMLNPEDLKKLSVATKNNEENNNLDTIMKTWKSLFEELCQR